MSSRDVADQNSNALTVRLYGGVPFLGVNIISVHYQDYVQLYRCGHNKLYLVLTWSIVPYLRRIQVEYSTWTMFCGNITYESNEEM